VLIPALGDDSLSQLKDENAVEFGDAFACSGIIGNNFSRNLLIDYTLDIELHLKIHSMYNKIFISTISKLRSQFSIEHREENFMIFLNYHNLAQSLAHQRYRP
jgi:hypothetical protein